MRTVACCRCFYSELFQSQKAKQQKLKEAEDNRREQPQNNRSDKPQKQTTENNRSDKPQVHHLQEVTFTVATGEASFISILWPKLIN